MLFGLILKREGYAVDSFTDSFDVLLNYSPNYYDLVLLDIRMSGLDGFELYAKIKEMDPNVKIYFLTAIELYLREDIKEEYKKLSSDLFIRKPIRSKELVGKVKQILKDDGPN